MINDLPQAFPALTLRWRATQQGHLLARGERQVAAAADTGSNVLDVPLTPVSATPLRVQTWLIDAQGKTLAENQLELEVAPADAR